ncbi:MAG: carboxypeptidase regulatory-like domain-containing protein, partial [Myxococcota bacterium]
HSINRITVHHTVTPNNDSDMASRMRQMQNYHMDSRGWCDLGYHFTVGQDGRIYQGRPEGYVGAHVAGANTGNAGISFIGTYSNVAPSSAMMNAGAKIIASIADYYGIAINRDRVKGHREYSSTECPGNALYPKMDELVALAQAYDGGDVTPTTGVLRGAVYHGDDLQNLANRISGATVSVSSGDSTTTDDEGWYSFDLAPGSYTVTADATGFSTESLDRDVTSGATTWGSIRLYPQSAGEEGSVRGVVFWVDDPSEYSQYVSDASRRLADATVTFSPGDYTATTGSDGYFQIEVPAGTYSVSASAEGYEDGERPDDVVVTAGEMTWGSTHVIRPGDEEPPPVVTITDPPDGTTVSLGAIEVMGTVSHSAGLESLTVDGADVAVSDGAFQTTVYLQSGENVIEAVAVDSLGQTGQDSITVVLDAPDGGIDGFVYDVSQGMEARLAGALVSFPEVDLEAVTDTTGSFSLDLAAGTYAVRISADGFVTHTGAISVVTGRRLNLRIGLEPGDEIVEQLVEISFPADGEILDSPDVLVVAAAADPELHSATINGLSAALAGDGSFSAPIALEPGENEIEAVAYREDESEIGRAVISVTHAGGGCGCTAGGGPGGSGLLLLLTLAGLYLGRRR